MNLRYNPQAYEVSQAEKVRHEIWRNVDVRRQCMNTAVSAGAKTDNLIETAKSILSFLTEAVNEVPQPSDSGHPTPPEAGLYPPPASS